MKRFAVVCTAVLIASLAGVARGQTTTRFVFTAVDAVRMATSPLGYSGPVLLVTGVLEGASAAAEETIYVSSSAIDIPECRRYALIAMSKPGGYKLSLLGRRATTSAGVPYIIASDCKLERTTP